MVAAQLFSKSLDLAAVVVVARFLTPSDFGLVALAASAMLIANSLTEIPVVEALIRRDHLDKEDLDSAFTLTVMRGLVIALCLFAASAPIATIFDDARLQSILMVMAIGPVAQGFASPNVAHSLKAVNYAIMAKAQLIGKTVAFIVMMALVWTTQSYWALVAGMVAHPAITALATHLLAPYRLSFSTQRIGSIIAFAGWVTLSRMVFTLNQQMDRLFVGTILGNTRLGLYAMAGDLSSMATYTVATPITQPLFAAFSTMNNDPERLRAAYLRSQQILFTVVAPIGFIFAALAEPVVLLILGETWLETVPLIQWLAPAIALQVLIIPTHALAMTLNRPKILVLREIASLLLRLPATLLAAWYFGLLAAVEVRSVAAVILIFFMLSIARNLLEVTVWRQIANCGRAFLALMLTSITAWLMHLHIPTPSSPLGRFAETVGLVFSSGFLYLALLLTLWAIVGRPNGAERWLLNAARTKLSRTT